MAQIKRLQYLVNKDVQLKYMGLVGIPLLILLGTLYYIMYYAMFNQMLIPEGVAATIVPAMKRVNSIMLFLLPISFFIVLRAALVYSNRIVGPFPRLERELDRVLAGDYSIRLKLRDKDALNDFVEKVNELLEKIEKEKTA